MRRGEALKINFVPEAVKIYGPDEVSNVMHDPGADFLVDNAVDEFNVRRRHGGPSRMLDYKPYEVRLAIDKDAEADKALLWLSRGAIDRYTTYVVQVDAGKAAHTDRATELAMKRLESHRGSVGFALFVQPVETSVTEATNIDNLRERVADLAIPTMDVILEPQPSHLFEDSTGDNVIKELTFDAGIVVPPDNILSRA